MEHKYVKVEGGDTVLIDLGGWGIVASVDAEKRWYDVAYVGIRYENGQAIPTPFPADMVVVSAKGTSVVEQAGMVTIWRHKAK